ncbi:hypothetical protein ACS0PU_005808 [Formica fusca]
MTTKRTPQKNLRNEESSSASFSPHKAETQESSSNNDPPLINFDAAADANANPSFSILGENFISAIQKPQLQPFMRDTPDLWFLLIDAEFQACRITNDATKYSTTLKAIDSATLKKISDILYKPPDTGKYACLKNVIIQRVSDSRDKRLHKLLRELELGDRKPSQLLREMRELAADGLKEDVLRSLWLDRMPAQIRSILVASEGIDLNGLAEIADRVLDTISHSSVMAVQKTSNSNNDASAVFKLEKRMDDLQRVLTAFIETTTKKFSELQFNAQSENNRSRSRSRSQTRSSTPVCSGVCYYHHRFGAEAQRCTKPCSFVSQNQGN